MYLVALIVAVWAVSVTGQVVAVLVGKEWVVPAGINEIGAGVAMWLVATIRAKDRKDRDEDEDEDEDEDDEP